MSAATRVIALMVNHLVEMAQRLDAPIAVPRKADIA
jgi:hypothetical protein